MPGAPSDREEPSSSSAGDTEESQESLELTELPSGNKDSEPSRATSLSPPHKRVRVEDASSDSENQGLSEDQTLLIDKARNTLTQANREHINHRYANIHMNAIDIDLNEESNQPEGRLRPKGKEADPCNWGGVQLMGREMNPEVQRRLLDSYYVRLERNDNQEERNQHEETRDYEETLETDDKERHCNRQMVGALLQASQEIKERERRQAKKRG
ncbi:hypothetical protein C0993_009660, partial [Termitomyces sp. T159_Od127]